MKQNVYFKSSYRYPMLLMLLICLAAGRPVQAQTLTVTGRVIDDRGQPLPGATVTVKGAATGVTADDQGIFTLHGIKSDDLLIVSSIGYETQEVIPRRDKSYTIVLKRKVNELDETIIRAYGTTTRRLNTGSIGKVTAEEIERQPVSNPLAALEGRVPGLVVTQSSGVPGSSFKVQIRGQNSIAQGSEPLFVIDGVPYAPGNENTNLFGSIANNGIDGGGLSPFNSINPMDIESIEVLKDADATAIYGSLGSNGVILITTKKGQPGKLSLNIRYNSGISKVSRTTPWLNTSQYLALRKEAFSNGQVEMDQNNAYDLLLFDTTRYTNFNKLLLGSTAHTNDIQTSFSGGDAFTRFLIGAGFHNETSIFPGDMSDDRLSTHMNFHHSTSDQKVLLDFTVNYGYENNNLISGNPVELLTLPPDYPSFFDSTGALVWQYKGRSLANPFAYLFQTYKNETDNLSARFYVSYNLFPGLLLKVNMGYSNVATHEESKIPSTSMNPLDGNSNSSFFGNNLFKTWIIEPQIEYKKEWRKSRLDILAGGTKQDKLTRSNKISGYNYANDALLGDISAAGTVSAPSNAMSEYKYIAVFGRINYSWMQKYILNVTGRRDGSSRFGPGKQFANFGSAGAAWIFSEESLLRKIGFLSYGKVRASYGASGNDQIGDYQYLNIWQSARAYGEESSIVPKALYNPDYSWESTRKFEVALEIGLFRDRILLTTSFFRNRSSNQLIQYQLPGQTGFNSVIENFPALVQNSGVELEGNFQLIKNRAMSWDVGFNISFPHNKLIAFPDIEKSSYAAKLIVGQPLSTYGGYHFLGVDPESGSYLFADHKGAPTSSPDYKLDWDDNLGNTDPSYYGGFRNSFQYKKFGLDLFFNFRKQAGVNYLYQLAIRRPGTFSNFPALVLNHWKKPGDNVEIAMLNLNPSSQAYQSTSVFGSYKSSGMYSDASFIRLKNISFSYELPSFGIKKVHLREGSVYIQAQNAFTITNYKGSDPETQNIYTCPPLKTFVMGIRLAF